MKRRFVLLLPLVLLFACDGGGDSSADVIYRLCPESAGVYMEVRDLSALDAEISKIARLFEPAVRETAYAQEAAAEMILCPGLLGVDLERPMAQVVLMLGEEPAQLMLVPVTSEADFQRGLESHPYWEYRKDSVQMKFVEGYAAIADSPLALAQVQLRSSPAPITSRLSGASLSVAIDLEAFGEMLMPQIEQGFAEMEGAFDDPDAPAPMKEFMDLYLKGVLTFLKESKVMAIGLDLSEGCLGMDMKIEARDGTDLAELFSGDSASEPRFLPLLTTTRGMAVEFHSSSESMARVFGPVFETLYAGLEEQDRELMVKSLTLTDGQGMAIDLANGLAMTAVSHLTDPEEYHRVRDALMSRMDEFLDDYLKTMMPPEAMGPDGEFPIRFLIAPGEAWEHAGVTVRTTSVGIELSDEIAEEMPAEIGKVLTYLFGGETLDFHEAMHGELALTAMGVGAKSEMTALIDRVLAGDTGGLPGHLATAFEGFPEKTNMLFTMDLAEIARMVANLDLDLGLSDEKMALLTNPPAGLTMSGYMATEEGTCRMGGTVALMDLMRYLKPMVEEVSQASPRGHSKKNELTCMNNLKQIGGMLAVMKAGRGYEHFGGSAFLLQIADQIKDEDLEVFICPGEDPSLYPDRPPVGSPEFIRMYREMDLTKDQDWGKYTSYAGPNWEEFPENPMARESRIWACDRCAGGVPHHGGIMVLFDSTRVARLEIGELEGHDSRDPGILVGPHSPDSRLSKMK